MRTHRGRRRLLGLAIGTLFVAPAPLAQAAAVGVDEVGFSYAPRQMDIVVNDRVVWTNRSSNTHTVTFDNGLDLHPDCDPGALLRVGCQGPGATMQHTFNAAGTFPYFCKIHRGQGMTGVIVVTAAATTTTAPATTTTTRAPITTTTRATSSTTSTTRPLSTSSTAVKSSTTTSDTSSVLLPGDAPALSGEDANSGAAGGSGGSGDDGGDSTTVTLIVGLLLAVSAGGGYLLWRLRPGRA